MKVTDEQVERAAVAMWMAESLRAASRPRSIHWDEENRDVQAKWRYLARVALEAQ